MSDIFISYSSKDRARAKVLAGALERQGWSVWWDRKIPPGKQFSKVIKKAMDEAKCVIVLWSKESVKSEWVQNEASEGARRKILVPALIDDVEIPFEFRRIQAARLVDWEERSPHLEFDTFLKALSAILGQPSLPKATEPTPDEQQPEFETKKAWSKSEKTKVLAAICIVTLITIVSIGVFLKYRQPQREMNEKVAILSAQVEEEPPYYGNSWDGNVRPQMEAYIRRFTFLENSKPDKARKQLLEMIEARKNPKKPTEYFDADNTFRAKLDIFRSNVRAYVISGKWPDD